MFADAIITQAAETHGVDRDGLVRILTENGWDFSALTERADAVRFVFDVVNGKAQEIAAQLARIEARKAAAAAARIAAMTPAARLPGALVCGKCDGKGRLACFGHIEKGVCFWCKGAGVIKPRKGR